MQGANLGATKQSKFFADPELTEISMRLYVPLLENDRHVLAHCATAGPAGAGWRQLSGLSRGAFNSAIEALHIDGLGASQ